MNYFIDRSTVRTHPKFLILISCFAASARREHAKRYFLIGKAVDSDDFGQLVILRYLKGLTLIVTAGFQTKNSSCY